MNKILIIEDDREIVRHLELLLKGEGFSCIHAYTRKDALTLIGTTPFDLALVDITLPDGSGYSLCTAIRQKGDIPVIFLTALGDESSTVTGFDLGADDYIRKPFSIAELCARVNAHLRREVRQPIRTLNRGGVRFDMQAKMAMIGEETLPFTKGEYAICEHMALHSGQVFTKEQLYEAVFGFDAEGDPSAIAEHIKNIRAKLKSGGLSPIETVWGVGYKWRKDSVL